MPARDGAVLRARVVRGLTPLRREVVPPYPSGEVPARMEELALRLISGLL